MVDFLRSQPPDFQQDCRREPFNPSNDGLERAQSISTSPKGAVAPETGKIGEGQRPTRDGVRMSQEAGMAAGRTSIERSNVLKLEGCDETTECPDWRNSVYACGGSARPSMMNERWDVDASFERQAAREHNNN
jgi:hypothetical protein